MTKRYIARMFPSTAAMYINFKRLAIGYGQWRTIRERRSVNALGAPIPWYTYPAIEYLSSFDFSECDIFEYGAGNSSLFWAGRSRYVVSVEDSEDWVGHVNNMALPNQIIIHRGTEDDYVSALSEQGKSFHIVVIDGKWRRRCTDEAMRYLEDGGMIVLDNSDRTIELDCSKVLRDHGFLQVDFSGFGPINGYCWTTSVFIKARTTLQRNFSETAPSGGLSNLVG